MTGAAAGRKRWPVNCTASSSLMMTQSTRRNTRSRPACAVSSQSLIVSQATKSAFSTWSRTSSCSSGWMLERKITRELRYAGGSAGWNPANTLSCVSSVSLLQADARIASRPAERLALEDLETAHVDVSRFQEGSMRRREIVADDCDELDGGEHRSGHAEVTGAAAEHLAGGLRRRMNGVECDRTDDEDWTDVVAHLELQMGNHVVSRQVVRPLEEFELDQEANSDDAPPELLYQ